MTAGSWFADGLTGGGLADRIAAAIDLVVADAHTALTVYGEPHDSVIRDVHDQLLRAASVDRHRLACARSALTRRPDDPQAEDDLGRLAQAYGLGHPAQAYGVNIR